MNHIVELRKKYGYSQQKLASLLGVHQTSISQWETEKSLPDIITAQKLALIFGVTIDDLLDDAGYSDLSTVAAINKNCRKLNDAGLEKVLTYTNDLLATNLYSKPIPNQTEHTGGKD